MARDDGFHALARGVRAIPTDLRHVPELKLRIWNTGFKNFDELREGFSNLVELEIMDYGAASFSPLASLRRLRRLTVMHFPRVTSFEPLSGLVELEELVLETLPSGDASGKIAVVASFKPLAGLTKLRVLKLAGVRTGDDDLGPLGSLSALRELAIGNLFPQRQFALLAKRLPEVRCGFLAPFCKLDGYRCAKCGGEKVMLTGTGVPNPKVVCPTCQHRKFAEVTKRFADFAEGMG